MSSDEGRRPAFVSRPWRRVTPVPWVYGTREPEGAEDCDEEDGAGAVPPRMDETVSMVDWLTPKEERRPRTDVTSAAERPEAWGEGADDEDPAMALRAASVFGPTTPYPVVRGVPEEAMPSFAWKLSTAWVVREP